MVRTTWIIFLRRIKGSQPKQNKFRKFAACQKGGEIAVLFEVALRSNLKTHYNGSECWQNDGLANSYKPIHSRIFSLHRFMLLLHR